MKKRDFIRLGQQLVKDLPNGKVTGPEIVLCPVEHVLRGITFESSSFDAKTFFVWFFCLPLCVPTNHLYFNFGDRLRTAGGADVWNADDHDLLSDLRRAISEQAVPYLSSVTTLEEMVRVLTDSPRPPAHRRQAIAYALARVGKLTEAEVALNELILTLDNNTAWQRVIADRAESLLAQLRSDPAAAQAQLENWEAQTIKNLNLDQVCR